jgi:DNA-directed RNA polymerase subunit RPC12/RpoP
MAHQPIVEFNSSPTIGAKGGGGRTGMMLWFAGMVILCVSALLGPLIYLGLLIAVGASLFACVLFFVGVPNFYRQGDCPHCGTTVKTIAEPGRAMTCSGCKHRLLLKEEHLHDVTA